MNRWIRSDRRRRILVDRHHLEWVVQKAVKQHGSENQGVGQVGLSKEQEIKPSSSFVSSVMSRSRLKGARPSSVRNRCVVAGYGRSVMVQFRRSRYEVRDLARKGKLPSYLKASW